MSTVELLREFQKLGCDDRIKCGVAARVQVDLVDVAKVLDVKSFYDDELKEIYFVGNETIDGVEVSNVFLPVLSSHNLDFTHMERVQNKLCKDKSIVLCICDSSSIVLYYRLTNNFQEKRSSKEEKTK